MRTINQNRIPEWYRTDASAAPGNSGGLAANRFGEFVGIPTAVVSEERTGGRFSGLLPLITVQALTDYDILELYDGSVPANVAPPEDTQSAEESPESSSNELDYQVDSVAGIASLQAGFSPDPFTLNTLAGGEIDAVYLGEGCRGFATSQSQLTLEWTGTTNQLRVLFIANTPSDDSTLLMRHPDGSWSCNDDANGNTRNPMLVFSDLQEGTHHIWLGSFREAMQIEGELIITELNYAP